MSRRRRRRVRIVSRLLAFTGITLPSAAAAATNGRTGALLGCVRACVTVLSLAVIVLSVLVYIYAHRSNVDEYVICLPYLLHSLNLLIVFLNTLSMREQIDHLLRRIDENVFTYADEEAIRVDYPWLCDDSRTGLVNACVFAYQFVGFSTVPFPLVEYYILNGKKRLIYPGWTPFDPDKYFWLINVFEFWVGFWVFWILFVCQLFVVCVTVEFARQNARLAVALSSVEARAKEAAVRNAAAGDLAQSKVGQFDAKRFADQFQTNLKQCIEHHQQLVKLFVIFESWFSTLFFAELLTDIVTFAVVFYNLFQTGSEVTFWGFLGSSFIFISALFSRCITGDIFSRLNKKISEIIFYEVRWYDQSQQNRKLLSMFLTQLVHRPMDLHAFSIFKASFFTFSSVIRTSYSYLNILKASLSAKN